MDDTNKKSFQILLTEVADMYDREMSTAKLRLYFNALKQYTLEQVGEALAMCVKSCKFFPKPADILELMPGGHPCPEEAWNALPKSEYDGGYVTDQMMACYPSQLLQAGDHIAARMAFIEAYKRQNKDGPPAFWYSAPSLGEYEQKLRVKESCALIAADKGWIDDNQVDTIRLAQKPAVKLQQLKQ